MKNITQLALTAIATLALGTAVLAEAAPEGGKGGRGRGGRLGGPPSPDRIVAQYGQIASYDTNKDGQLDESEAQKLWNDISTYDYSGELIAQVGQIQAWISKFDTNKNGKLTIGELYMALSKFV